MPHICILSSVHKALDNRVYIELGLQELIKTAVKTGLGVGTLSRFVPMQELSSGTLGMLVIEDLPAIRHVLFYLVFHRVRKLSPVTEALFMYAREWTDSDRA